MSGIVLNNTPKKIDKGRDRILNNSPKKIITEKDQIYLTAIWSFFVVLHSVEVTDNGVDSAAIILNIREKRWKEILRTFDLKQTWINTKDGGTFLWHE